MVMLNDVFPSNYLKAADLGGRTLTLVIDRCETELIGSDRKLVLYFKDKSKGLVLNKTNATNIATVYGQDTDAWEGGDLSIFPTVVDYQGKSVDAIRVKVPPRAPARVTTGVGHTTGVQPARQPEPVGDFHGGHDPNDDIPF